MASDRPIPTPLGIRVRRARERVIPAAVFLLAATLTTLLWTSQAARPQLVGEAVALTYELRAASDGVLVRVPGMSLDRFEPVRLGQLIAQLDDGPVLAEHATMLAELVRLRTVLTAAEREALTQAAEFDLDALSLARRLAVDVEGLRLDAVSLTARIQADESRLARAEIVLDAVQQAFEQGAENSVALDEERLRRDEIASRLEGQRAELAETRTQIDNATERLESMQTPPGFAELDVVLAPLRAELTVHESRLRELEIEAGALSLRSPIEGTIAAVHARPGQPVREGDPLLTVTAREAHTVVAYLREPTPAPAIGAAVLLVATQTRAAIEATVDAIGPAVEPIPERLLRTPGFPEWGRAVRITIPDGVTMTPGELVSIRVVSGA